VRQHGGVAHAGIEQPQSRRIRLQKIELARGALCDLPFLVRRVDERQILLTVVVEAKRPISGAGGRCGSFGLRVFGCRGFALRVSAHSRALIVALDVCGAVQRRGRRLTPDEPADLRGRLERNVFAVA
jgi:hypothetical protein